MKYLKLAIGLTLTAVAVGAGIHFYNKRKKDTGTTSEVKSDKLSESDWNDLMTASVDRKNKTGKSNAVSLLSGSPIISDVVKQQFLQNGNRNEYNTLMSVIKSDKSDPDSIDKAQTAILNFINRIATKQANKLSNK